MNSGRLFRAVVTGITLIICLWALNHLEGRRASRVVSPPDTLGAGQAAPAKEKVSLSDPAIGAETLPFVALDNTCYYSEVRDLSKCTGILSGGPAREYRIMAKDATTILYIDATPRSEDFDLGFALYTHDEQCLTGKDDHGPGIAEEAVVNDLSPGEYLLVVGGYADQCGAYELTVRTDAPEIAQVTTTGVLAGPNGKVVRWGTFAENDVQKFVLYRTEGENRECVAVLRPHGSPAGFAKYRVMDRRPQPDSTYEIEAVASDGRTERVSVTA